MIVEAVKTLAPTATPVASSVTSQVFSNTLNETFSLLSGTKPEVTIAPPVPTVEPLVATPIDTTHESALASITDSLKYRTTPNTAKNTGDDLVVTGIQVLPKANIVSPNNVQQVLDSNVAQPGILVLPKTNVSPSVIQAVQPELNSKQASIPAPLQVPHDVKLVVGSKSIPDLPKTDVSVATDAQPVSNLPAALPQVNVSQHPVLNSNVIPDAQKPVKVSNAPIDAQPLQENTTPQSTKDIPQDAQKPTSEGVIDTVVPVKTEKADKKKKEEDSPIIMQPTIQPVVSQLAVQNSTSVKESLIVGAQQKEGFVPGMPVEKQVDPQKTTEVFSLVEAPKIDTPKVEVKLDVIPKPVTHPEWNKDLGERIVWMASKSIPTAEIRLNPEHLGPISVRVEVADDKATVVFTAQHAATKEAIEASMPKLREMMSAQQLNLDVSVSQGNSGGQSRPQTQNYTGHVIDDEVEHEITSGKAVVSDGLLSIYV